MVETISLSFDSMSILIRVSTICFSIFSRFSSTFFLRFSLSWSFCRSGFVSRFILTDLSILIRVAKIRSSLFLFSAFYLGVIVGATISLSFDCFSILIRVAKRKKKSFFFVFYIEFSVVAIVFHSFNWYLVVDSDWSFKNPCFVFFSLFV